MSTSPTTYSPGELISRMARRNKKDEVQKQCPNCRRGMYKTGYGKIQCENCDREEPEAEYY